MSCETNIPAEWQAAIESNNCPRCGNVILDDDTKKLFDELRSLMVKMDEAPEGVKELLLSNYNLVTVEQAKKMGPENIPNNLKVAANPVQQWLARSAAPKLAQRENLKDLVQRIQDVQSEEDNSMLYVDPDMIEDEVPMQSHPTLAKKILENNSVIMGSGNVPPPTPAEKQALMNALQDSSAMDGIDDLPEALQHDRMNRLEQRRRVASGVGGGSGTFHRSD